MDRPGNGRASALKLLGLMLALNVGVLLAGLAMQYWSPAAPAPLVFNAEKIHLLASPTPFEREIVGVDQLAAPANPLIAVVPPSGAGDASNLRCLSWEALDSDALTEAEAYLQKIGIATDDYRIELDKTLGWWVFLRPFKDKAELDAMIEAVRRLGVNDLAPVRGGSMRNALSLGAFATLAQARAHAASLGKKGVKEVKYGPRPESGVARLIISESISDTLLSNAESGWPKGLQPSRCAQP